MEGKRTEYLQPPMRMAGSFGKTAELEYMLIAYFHLRVIEPWNLETIKFKVRKCAAACHFWDDRASDWEFDAYAAALYRTVCELKHSPVRTGPAEGPLAAGEERVGYLLLLAHEGCGAPGKLLHFLASEAGYTPEELFDRPGLMTENGQTYGQCYDELLEQTRRLLAVMDADEFSRASALAAADTELRADKVALTSLLMSISDEAKQVRRGADVATRCVWPRRFRVLADESEEIRKRFRSEAMNPLFLEGMAAHGRRGAMAIAAYVARSCQWDAVCQGLEGWMYEEMARMYALSPTVQRWMLKTCPGALRHLTGSLLAAARGTRWRASLKTRTELMWLYSALESQRRGRREAEVFNREQA